MKKAALILVIVILLAVFAFSAWQLYDIFREYRLGELAYEALDIYVSIPEATSKPTTAPEESTEPEGPRELLWPEVDFDALRQLNPDVIGWIHIPDTQVSYPIVQGSSNDEYLYRLITGEYNSAGSLFLEAGMDPTFVEQNNPVYGHNMKNGTMLAGITGYRAQEFYDTHPIGLLLTPDGNYQVHFFSAYVTDAYGDAWDTLFSQEKFQQWLQKLERRSYFSTEVIPTVQDRVLTLSTCTYDTADARFVVHGILIPQAETDTKGLSH